MSHLVDDELCASSPSFVLCDGPYVCPVPVPFRMSTLTKESPVHVFLCNESGPVRSMDQEQSIGSIVVQGQERVGEHSIGSIVVQGQERDQEMEQQREKEQGQGKIDGEEGNQTEKQEMKKKVWDKVRKWVCEPVRVHNFIVKKWRLAPGQEQVKSLSSRMSSWGVGKKNRTITRRSNRGQNNPTFELDEKGAAKIRIVKESGNQEDDEEIEFFD